MNRAKKLYFFKKYFFYFLKFLLIKELGTFFKSKKLLISKEKIFTKKLLC